MPSWMRFIIALSIVPCAFLTEYFLVAKFLGYIHVSYAWMIYTLLADAGNGAMIRWLVKRPQESK